MKKNMLLIMLCIFFASSSGFASTPKSESIKDGIHKAYYKTGQLRLIENYKNGKFDGERKVFYENGQIRVECIYKDGKPVGVRKKYWPDGQIRQEIIFKPWNNFDGWLAFHYKDYYTNGIIYEEGVVSGWKGQPEKVYYENGKLLSEKVRLIPPRRNGSAEQNSEIRYYDPNGNQIKDGIISRPFPDGGIAKEMQIKNGEFTGLEKQFYKKGRLKSETIFENGKTINRDFYENGKLMGEAIYDGSPQGIQKFYDKDGKFIGSKVRVTIDEVYPAAWDNDE